MDFLNSEFICAINGDLKNVHSSAVNQFLIKESQWFSPNHGEIGHYFRDVFENYKNYTENAKRQAYRSKTGFSWDKMKEKVDLAKNIIDNKLLPTDWVYDNIFHFSDDEYAEYRDLIREDAKREFRITQIKEEGNDPLETGKSYGTPHDLAYLYGASRAENSIS